MKKRIKTRKKKPTLLEQNRTFSIVEYMKLYNFNNCFKYFILTFIMTVVAGHSDINLQ